MQKLFTSGTESMSDLSSAWILFFAGCLVLYVPDRPFDPALRPMLERDSHIKQKRGLQDKLKALRDFEMIFTGQSTSLRTQLAEQDLKALGDEPRVTAIVRPHVSLLAQLQGEFNNMHRSIISRVPDIMKLQLLFSGNMQIFREIELLRSNIAQAILRLSDGYRAYDDITKPIVAMLQGLDVGLTIALVSTTPTNECENAIQHICQSTPFLGMRPDYATKGNSEELSGAKNKNPFSHQVSFLGFAAARSLSTEAGELSTQRMFKAFHSSYEYWKEQLGEDQRKDMAKSSMYRHRGGEEDNEEDDENEFCSLFPIYEAHEHKETDTEKHRADPRSLAQHLARGHRDVFTHSKDTSHYLLEMLRVASESIALLWQYDSAMSKYPVMAIDMLSGLILSLDKTATNLQGSLDIGTMYNFYADANLVEARRLIKLVREVYIRFSELKEAWPEHATIQDVLRTSAELMELRHTEPIAKILTKAEQVHSFIHEWQVIASREYSTVALYDQFTNMLVDWRRLELSTWARLLDMEDKKCNEDADSWWFIAYEVTIAAPLSMLNSGTSLQSYVEQLFTILGNFLATTSQGQYSARLLLLECFSRHLSLLARDFPAMKIVHTTIANFLSYYKRFEKMILDSLRKGRQGIETKLREVLLLASWKDTNIIALRDSAKRSHHKLFKIIRKYRTLLAQPTQDMISRGIPERQDSENPAVNEIYQNLSVGVDPHALEVCQQHFMSWLTKPARFTKPDSTANFMSFKTRMPSTAIDSTSLLETLANDLIDNIKILRKETPPTVTKDNSKLVKHLKSRKRKLFSDTLKTLRRMGLRSNLGEDALARQASLSIVLANSPAYDEVLMGTDLSIAEYHFHKILSIIPQAKELFRNHSQDLSTGEVARSIGYLQSILSLILEQRATSIASLQNLKDLDQTIEKMRSSWAPASYILKLPQTSHKAHAASVKCAVQWLPTILDVGCVIIEKHGKLGGSDSSHVLEGLRSWVTKMANVRKEYGAMPDLPVLISSSGHEQTHERADTLLKQLRDDLHKWTEEATHISFVLRQINLWTETSQLPSEAHINGVTVIDIAEVDNNVSQVVDLVLIAVQGIEKAHLSIPSSDQESGWLAHTNHSLADGLKLAHTRDIGSLLEDVMFKIHRIQTKDDVGLNVAGAIFAMALPTIQRYRDIQKENLDRYAKLQQGTCKLASVLAQSFSKLASEGFCTPSESSAAESGMSEKLEEGTGLGEGEGADDISKDVQDDEDLSELAQEGRKSKDKEEIEDREDAVDMDHDELEGELGDAPDKEDGSASESGENDNTVDEETGDVDDLDPSAVDEKLWDGNAEDAAKEKEGSKGTGEKQKDEQMAAQDGEKEDADTKEAGGDGDISQEGADEDEAVAREEMEKVDPYLQEGQNLDLPEEMDFDHDNDSTARSSPGESDLDGLADVDHDEAKEEKSDVMDEDGNSSESAAAEEGHPQLDVPEEDVMEDDVATGDTQDAGSPVDTEPEDDEQEPDKGLLRDKTNDANIDPNDTAVGDAGGVGEDTEQQNQQEKTQDTETQGSKGAKGNSSAHDDPRAFTEDGQLGQIQDNSENVNRGSEDSSESGESQAFRKLGNALEKWHRQRDQIRNRPENIEDHKPNAPEVNGMTQEFEHLHDKGEEADTQALGAATEDEAHALDERALDSEMQDQIPESLPDEVDNPKAEDQDDVMQDVDTKPATSKSDKEQSRPGALVGPNNNQGQQKQQTHGTDAENEEEIDDLDINFSTTHLQSNPTTSPRNPEEARRLWFHYESLTRSLSLSLTEELRLILAPTLATKLRGDFRTGKSLNIKRIIPYIASQYKRDKIWMRRSVPSKRNYQIMLAVDDSKSMGESGSGQLAFETLALVSKSLSMLEVGEICVVGFGESVIVTHEFDAPFSSDAGAQIFEHFTFQQTTTNVRKLVAESISLFRSARAKSRSGSTDLWQLELIISDGVCEDHEGIRRLVRQAQEERIMIVFVIVDALRGESIMDMSEAVFEDDGVGESKLRIRRYLDGFPFGYYLVVGDVTELPGVLATALRQWFAEVVETG